MTPPATKADDKPILYSFRRCPFAMRARLALQISGVEVRLREILLRDKPAEMLAASAKGTVPVLVLPDGRVIDESLDVMTWALGQNDPESWLGRDSDKALPSDNHADQMTALIQENDGSFKAHLDRYKYAARYEGVDSLAHREAGGQFLWALDARLQRYGQLFGPRRTMADAAIFPFVRQFRIADPDWFDVQGWSGLNLWVQTWLRSPLFLAIMEKYSLWKSDGAEHVFASHS